MFARDYEIALFANAVWRLAFSSEPMELLAVACTIRNYVVPRMGVEPTYASFSEACDDFLSNYPIRSGPKLDDPALVLPPDGLLCRINSVYDCSMQDVTSSQDNPKGARHFARVISLPSEHWLQGIIKTRELIGSFGAMQFYC